MEKMIKEDCESDGKYHEKDTDIQNKNNENGKYVDAHEPIGEKGDTVEIISTQEDNLKDNIAKSIQREAGEINSTRKNDKLSDVDCYDSCSSGTNSNDTSNGNVIKTGNSSLSNLLVYNTSDESSDSESSSDSDSYESPQVSDNEQESECGKNDNKKKNVQDTIRTFGELTLDDLPPVPDVSTLDVDVAEHECIPIGNITGIIDRLVTVESLPNTPAYDLDTLLFLDNGKKPLGYVYDVMGPVSNPIYVIRFNTKEEMDNIGVAKGLPVYSAPNTPHTQYVFLKQLMQVKGSDASWMGDNEVPAEHVEYSDDEEERRVRSSKKSPKTRKRNSVDRHKDFEKDMNVKNIIDTRLHKIRDSFEPSTKRHASNNNDKRGFPFQHNTGPVYSFGQPGLNPSVPSFNPYLASPYMPNGMPMPPFGTLSYIPHNIPPMHRMPPIQNVPYVPSIPPPQLPHTMTTQTMQPPMQNLQNIAITVDVRQPKHPQPPPRMLYPPEMGLPRPPRNTFLPMYNPRIPTVWTYQNHRPQNIRPAQNFCQPRPRGAYFVKKP